MSDSAVFVLLITDVLSPGGLPPTQHVSIALKWQRAEVTCSTLVGMRRRTRYDSVMSSLLYVHVKFISYICMERGSNLLFILVAC